MQQQRSKRSDMGKWKVPSAEVMHLVGNDTAAGCLHDSGGRQRIPSEQGCGWQQHAVGAALGLVCWLQGCAAVMASGASGLLGRAARLESTLCCRAWGHQPARLLLPAPLQPGRTEVSCINQRRTALMQLLC